jgi:hypothetical protein
MPEHYLVHFGNAALGDAECFARFWQQEIAVHHSVEESKMSSALWSPEDEHRWPELVQKVLVVGCEEMLLLAVGVLLHVGLVEEL